MHGLQPKPGNFLRKGHVQMSPGSSSNRTVVSIAAAAILGIVCVSTEALAGEVRVGGGVYAAGVRGGGAYAAGIRGGGVEAAEVRGGGVEAVGVHGGGVEAAGVHGGGVEAVGVDGGARATGYRGTYYGGAYRGDGAAAVGAAAAAPNYYNIRACGYAPYPPCY